MQERGPRLCSMMSYARLASYTVCEVKRIIVRRGWLDTESHATPMRRYVSLGTRFLLARATLEYKICKEVTEDQAIAECAAGHDLSIICDRRVCSGKRKTMQQTTMQ
jgi:hypothetical protein